MVKTNTRNLLDPRTLEFSWKLPILSSITTPPSNPKNGARHRIIGVATGVWAGKENQIAIYDADGESWFYETYTEGSVLYDFGASDFRYVKSDLSWEQFDKIPLAISDVTGLQTELNGKSSVGHLHAIADVTGLQTALNAKEDSLPSKIGESLKYLRVNVGEDGFEFSAVSGGSTSFADDVFDVHDEADVTKIVKIDAGTLIPTGTIITLKIKNENGTVPTLESNQVFSALVQALTMVATNSMTTDKLVLSDASTDPLVNGEIQNNSGVVKVKTNGVVKNLGSLSETDEVTVNGVTLPLGTWLLI